jgi:hypothetical protein
LRILLTIVGVFSWMGAVLAASIGLLTSTLSIALGLFLSGIVAFGLAGVIDVLVDIRNRLPPRA